MIARKALDEWQYGNYLLWSWTTHRRPRQALVIDEVKLRKMDECSIGANHSMWGPRISHNMIHEHSQGWDGNGSREVISPMFVTVF